MPVRLQRDPPQPRRRSETRPQPSLTLPRVGGTGDRARTLGRVCGPPPRHPPPPDNVSVSSARVWRACVACERVRATWARICVRAFGGGRTNHARTNQRVRTHARTCTCTCTHTHTTCTCIVHAVQSCARACAVRDSIAARAHRCARAPHKQVRARTHERARTPARALVCS